MFGNLAPFGKHWLAGIAAHNQSKQRLAPPAMFPEVRQAWERGWDHAHETHSMNGRRDCRKCTTRETAK